MPVPGTIETLDRGVLTSYVSTLIIFVKKVLAVFIFLIIFPLVFFVNNFKMAHSVFNHFNPFNFSTFQLIISSTLKYLKQ